MQKEILLSYELHSGKTFSSVVESLPFPKSTSKYIMKQFKSFGLLDFGDRDNRGAPLKLTSLGVNFVEVLRGDRR